MMVRRFSHLERLARERAYTVRRRGREVHWSRNSEPGRFYVSCGVAEAVEDILLDCSSEKSRPSGSARTQERRT